MLIISTRFCLLYIGLFLAVFLMGCATISSGDKGKFFFTAWQNNQVYKGKGGKMTTINNVEFWNKDEPNKAYQIVGVIIHITAAVSLDKLLLGEINQDKLADIIIKEKANGLLILSDKWLVSGRETQKSTEYSKTSVFAVFRYIDTNTSGIKNVKSLR